MVTKPAIIVLSDTGAALGARIRDVLGGELHGLAKRCSACDVAFEDTLAHVRELFAEGRPIIGVCASGILIRAVAGGLESKRDEPPVLAVSDDGSAIVPLLGGHHGANDMARKLARALGSTAAITTAGDVRFGVALDAPPAGWTLANPEDAKPAMAALLDGARARLTGNALWLSESALPFAGEGTIELVATHRYMEGGPSRLIYHPRTIVVGVGCERGCAAGELEALVSGVIAQHGLANAAIAAVVSIDVKADETAVHEIAGTIGVPARFVTADAINEIAERIANPSDIVMREVGCPGVAEGAALVATGGGGNLIVEKTKSARATCAIAEAAEPLDAGLIGRARGRVSLIGLGPGNPEWRSPQASALLEAAGDWVGYGLYLDLAADLNAGKTEHRFELGEEEARVRHALELAGSGRDVALVCSGDAGIYAMAALVFELIDAAPGEGGVSDAARRAEVTVVPGISAFQAAAARAGAPIGHDFCAISLSDLLTPWEVIERRLVAATEGDFVVAFYNPRSLRRHAQLGRAIEILRTHRPPSTPVIIATDLGRPKEKMRIVALEDFDPEMVDMLTMVLVGSSTTRLVEGGDGKRWAYTPRGYEKKRRELAS